MLADIESQVMLFSHKTKVVMPDHTTLELSEVNGKLNNEAARDAFSKRMKEQFNIQHIIYRDSIHTRHINNFHNIEIQ